MTNSGPDKSTEQPSVHDHREGMPRNKKAGVRDYPFETVPAGDTVIEVADGILWARIPLPWSLDHINVYLLEEEDGWVVIDTGSLGKTGIEVWEKLEVSVLKGKPITKVVATHMHPDHLGLAGWLVERHGAEFFMTQTEYLLANVLWLDSEGGFPEHELDFIFKGGVDRQVEPALRAHGSGHFKKGVHKLPPSYNRLEEGVTITLGGRDWLVVIGKGHSPEHACLYCLDEPLFIAGDQVLPEITSNVSVYAREPKGNPLAQWIISKERLLTLPGDPMVLPSHGPVFMGLHGRVSAVVDGHFDRLSSLHEKLQAEWHSPVETFKYLFRRKIKGLDFFLALGESRAHLNLLERLGLVEQCLEDGVQKFRSLGVYDDTLIREQVRALPGQKMTAIKLP